jgi:hypothetical protein
MEKKFEITTPIGIGAVQYGHFMPHDERGGKFHCWFNGCGLGREKFDTIDDAKEYLFKYIDNTVKTKIRELDDIVFGLKSYLKEPRK